MKKIGIVGLGIMGRGMAVNFIKNGYEVFVWNRTKSVSEGIEGARICESPKEVVEKADIIFEVTANDESSREVWLSENGIIYGLTSEKIGIICSTVSIEWTNELIAEMNKKSFTLLDIPLTGGRVGAETGNMTLLCGGDKDVVESLKPTFEAIAGNVFYFGEVGSGMKYKLLLNFVQGTHIVAFGQAMKLAKKSGMNLESVADGLAFRPGGVITNIAKDTYFNDPDPITFSVEWITKDLTYAKQLADMMNVKLSLLEATLSEYKKIFEKYKDRDWASVNKLIEKIED